MSEPSAWLDDTMGGRTVWRHVGAGRIVEMTADYANSLEAQLTEAISQRQSALDAMASAVEEAAQLRAALLNHDRLERELAAAKLEGWCDDGKHVVEAGMTHCICGILQLGATAEALVDLARLATTG